MKAAEDALPEEELRALKEQQAESDKHEKNKTAHFSALGRTFAGGGRGLSLTGRGGRGVNGRGSQSFDS